MESRSARDPDARDASRVAALARAFGMAAVSGFVVAPGNAYFLASDRRSALAYRESKRTRLVIGDPLGPVTALPALLDAFERDSRKSSRRLAVYQAREELLPLYRARGWHAVRIGEEPVLQPARFSLEGSALGTVRRAVRKLERGGLEVRMHFPGRNPFRRSQAEHVAAQMDEISASWLAAHASVENTFCMGRYEPRGLERSWIALALDSATQRVQAFCTWAPIGGRHGHSLDLMRRRADAPTGVMDLLVAKSLEAAAERGDEVISLALAALARVEAPSDADVAPARGRRRTATARAVRDLAARRLANFYDFQGLLRWKSKFAPAFEHRYLVFPHRRSLPGILLALARVQNPAGLRGYVRGGRAARQ